MLPVTLRDMRVYEDELVSLLTKYPKSNRLQSRLRNLRIKMAKKSASWRLRKPHRKKKKGGADSIWATGQAGIPTLGKRR